MLEGWEVKSLREGKLNIKEAYIKDIKGELWLVGARINPASYINQKDQVNPERFRKLLLNNKEIEKIQFAISAKGQTCVPVKLFWKGHLAKLEIALAKGKKNYDKKQVKKTADIAKITSFLRNIYVRLISMGEQTRKIVMRLLKLPPLKYLC